MFFLENLQNGHVFEFDKTEQTIKKETFLEHVRIGKTIGEVIESVKVVNENKESGVLVVYKGKQEDKCTRRATIFLKCSEENDRFIKHLNSKECDNFFEWSNTNFCRGCLATDVIVESRRCEDGERKIESRKIRKCKFDKFGDTNVLNEEHVILTEDEKKVYNLSGLNLETTGSVLESNITTERCNLFSNFNWLIVVLTIIFLLFLVCCLFYVAWKLN